MTYYTYLTLMDIITTTMMLSIQFVYSRKHASSRASLKLITEMSITSTEFVLNYNSIERANVIHKFCKHEDTQVAGRYWYLIEVHR